MRRLCTLLLCCLGFQSAFAETAVVANQPRVEITFHSVSEIIDQIPKSHLPLTGQTAWTDPQLDGANKWLADNVVGQKMRVTAKLGDLERQPKTIAVDFGFDHYVMNNLWFLPHVKGVFSKDQANLIAKETHGQPYAFSGTIAGIRLTKFSLAGKSGNLGPRADQEPTDQPIWTNISIELVNCLFFAPQPEPLIKPIADDKVKNDQNKKPLGEPHKEPNYQPLGTVSTATVTNDPARQPIGAPHKEPNYQPLGTVSTATVTNDPNRQPIGAPHKEPNYQPLGTVSTSTVTNDPNRRRLGEPPKELY